jgi:hypothetical protein
MEAEGAGAFWSYVHADDEADGGLLGAGADLLDGLLTLVERTNQEDQRDDEERRAGEAKDPDRLSSLWAHRSPAYPGSGGLG